jgi:hypothetical protein
VAFLSSSVIKKIKFLGQNSFTSAIIAELNWAATQNQSIWTSRFAGKKNIELNSKEFDDKMHIIN